MKSRKIYIEQVRKVLNKSSLKEFLWANEEKCFNYFSELEK